MAIVNTSLLLRKETVNIVGIKNTKNALRHALVTFVVQRSSLKIVPSLVLGLSKRKKEKQHKKHVVERIAKYESCKASEAEEAEVAFINFYCHSSNRLYSLKAPIAQSAGTSNPITPKTLRYLSSSFQYWNSPKRLKKLKKNR